MSSYVCGPDTFGVLAAHADTTGEMHGDRSVRLYGTGWTAEEIAARYGASVAARVVLISHFGSAGVEIPTSGAEGRALVAEILIAENVHGVCARYNDPDKWEQVTELVTSLENLHYQRIDPIAAFNVVRCLRCQSCDSDDYETSLGARLLQAIEQRLISQIPEKLQGPWGVDGDYLRRVGKEPRTVRRMAGV